MQKSYFGRLLDKILRRNTEDEYHRWLLRYGRVVEGRVLDADDQDVTATTIYYCYYISNVRYESSQLLTPEQRAHHAKYYPGAAISVRFDPRYPARAVVE